MYELIEWQGKEEDIEIKYMPVLIGESDSLESNSIIPSIALEGDEKVDIIDVTFSSSIKKAERSDYLFAILSGAISSIVDVIIVGQRVIDVDLDKKNLQTLAVELLKHYAYSQNIVKVFDNKFSDLLATLEGKINRAGKYEELFNDFSRQLSVKGMIVSIISKCIGYKIGETEEGEPSFVKVNNTELQGAPIYKRIILGFIEWILIQAEEYAKTGKFEEEVNDIIAIKGLIDYVKPIIKELGNSELMKKQDSQYSKIYEWFEKQIVDETNEELTSLQSIMNMQSLPVVINRSLVRAYYFVKMFLKDIKDKKIKSLKGLEFIDVSTKLEANRRIISRMDTVSTGVCATVDGSHAIIKGLSKGSNPIGLIANIATYINFVNWFELVAVIRVDADYIKQDFKTTKDDKKTKTSSVSEQKNQKNNTYTLNDIETKILYSLQLQKIKYDIKATKDSDTQIKKNEWMKLWQEKVKKAQSLNKLFMEDEKKLYAMIKTHASTNKANEWLYTVALELDLFTPYFQLEQEDSFKKLKVVHKTYLEDVFVQKQDVASLDDIKVMRKLYKNYKDLLSGSEKKLISVAGTALVTVATAVGAYVFAPAIAVMLVGGSFAGLSGAALTSASLALLGGGAIATGGLGMAGGAMVIAGGGALIGLGASGLTSTTILLMSSSNYILQDYAKLLTRCDYVLLGKYGLTEKVNDIQKALENSIQEQKIHFNLLKEKARRDNHFSKDSKAMIKEYEKRIKICKRANTELIKMINSK